MTNVAYNIDCMEYMQTVPDLFFDLAVVDPPYGIRINENIGRRKGDKPSGRKKAYWDYAPPRRVFHRITEGIKEPDYLGC